MGQKIQSFHSAGCWTYFLSISPLCWPSLFVCPLSSYIYLKGWTCKTPLDFHTAPQWKIGNYWERGTTAAFMHLLKDLSEVEDEINAVYFTLCKYTGQLVIWRYDFPCLVPHSRLTVTLAKLILVHCSQVSSLQTPCSLVTSTRCLTVRLQPDL